MQDQENLDIDNSKKIVGIPSDEEIVESNKETKDEEMISEPEVIENQDNCKKGKNSCHKKSEIAHWVVEGVLFAAVIALFILHFVSKGNSQIPIPAATGEPGSGEIIFVNMDTIQEKYEMVSLLVNDIDAEKQKQEIHFQNRQKALENKVANFQQNYQSGQLNQKQVEYAQISLQEESEKLQADYERTLSDLEARYVAALQQVTDSLNAACQRVNAQRNASFIFTYQTGGQLLYADPTKDMTNVIVNELNKSFKKGNKK